MMDWTTLKPIYLDAIWQTLFMAVITLVVGGVLGLVLGIFLFATRRGGLLANRTANLVLNVIVNIVRPIPFIIFMTAIGPLTLKVVGTTIGVQAATFPLCIAATFAMSRIVEQNLVTVDPGVIEAARAMGAGPWRILFDVVAREALGPLILGYTYVLIAIVDMTAIAGAIGGGGLGQFAIQYGYQRFNWTVTLIAVVTIIIIVQAAQFAGNALARKALRR
ncbi:MAG: methionine ABC transporter permease [Acidipropionibacterium acidipropionici]|uniref:Methionine ABC transporter ATP-binding protein n=2 Tax=Acidipropionibacterium acidipropionici TaxID=1748 RepID=A0AAC9AN41_9ACTN|nr:methionine ABC transporter permease [Acidipropionibacterium acidipropionici]AMS05005.1 methionine ABC transporter ATP-binding protein [Acidipropionibacterium acidipropionici]AOZ46485.1 methionine ABC transporter ATP-binding protein [Acidipropionibacterium acidipropionici]AZP37465.1 ABC transporter permease [Acidipropionibacterium acidipropionici]MDN6556052.1 ABC transporter permease [Acidipropionibacterium acidipropionici]QCV94505.1 ABC transporter permease [Acidipropionibacterium acidiprop